MKKGKKSRKKLHRLDKIMCLEGEWSADIRSEESVKPLLQTLQRRGEIKYIYRRCGTKSEFEYYLRLKKYYRDYRIVYLSFHGARGKLKLSPDEVITLAEIADIAHGAFKNKIVYFGSCKTLKAVDEQLKDEARKRLQDLLGRRRVHEGRGVGGVERLRAAVPVLGGVL